MDLPHVPERLPSDKEEIERLMEIHEDFRAHIEARRRRFRFKLRLCLVFLLIAALFAFLEITRTTRITRTFLDYFDVHRENRPRDGKMLPMNFGGRSSLLIAPEDDLPSPCRKRSFLPQPSESGDPSDAGTPDSPPGDDPS
jgi:hypothetical protein